MKSKGKKTGFSIVELLTVMSIIMILLSIMIPSLNAVRRYAKEVKQKALFNDISKGLEMFRVDYEDYPDSFWNDLSNGSGQSYCGAMKLCEAMVGQDGLGFHPDSVFDDMGLAADGTTKLYYNRAPLPDPIDSAKPNLRARKAYLEGEEVQTISIEAIETKFGFDSAFDPCCVMLSDVFKRTELKTAYGRKLGMPILYYKANPSKLTHEYDEMITNIYLYADNHEILEIEPPWSDDPNGHPLHDPGAAAPPADAGYTFYNITTNPEVTVETSSGTYAQPYNKDSYILISAGHDGLYGTRDDVFNFDKK